MEDQKDSQDPSISLLPTIQEYDRKYGISLEGNDQKAVRAFREFESREKLVRLRNELIWVKSEIVTEKACNWVIGKKRKAKHGSYKHWAELMLLWMLSKRK